MSKKVRRVPYTLDDQGIADLPREEIATILRGADDLIMRGGRNLLAKILKGSRDKRLLELGLDASPVYGAFRDLTIAEITARIDWVILHGYLAIQYDYRLPLLVYTKKGWKIERNTYASELLAGFDQLLESGQTAYDMSYLKDRSRDLALLLLGKVKASGDAKYIPLLEAWAEIDYKEIKSRIWGVIQHLRSRR